MKTDAEQDTSFISGLFMFFISHSATKGISMNRICRHYIYIYIYIYIYMKQKNFSFAKYVLFTLDEGF